MQLTRRTKRWLFVGFLFFALLVTAALAFDLRTVSTGSMEPTLWGRGAEGRSGDLLLIDRFAYWVREPERFEVAVFRVDADDSLRTKRVHGLPGEAVQIVGGDLYIDDALYRKNETEWCQCAISIFDSARHPYEGERGFWYQEDYSASEALDSLRDRKGPLRLISRPLRSDYRRENEHWQAGAFDVRDVEVELHISDQEGGGTLEFRWQHGEETIAELNLDQIHRSHAMAVRWQLREQDPIAYSPSMDATSSDQVTIRMRRLDGVWTLEIRYGAKSIKEEWRLEEDFPGGLSRRWKAPIRLILEMKGKGMRLHRCEVRRDLFHADPRSSEGASTRHKVGPNDYFVLGDHAEDSRDSLTDGDVARSAFLGCVRAVVAPAARRRWLP